MMQFASRLALMGAVISMSQMAKAEEKPLDKPHPSDAPVLMMSDEGLRERQDHLLKMHDLSNKILSERDPSQKQKLKEEQLQLMKAFELEHHRKMQHHMHEMMKRNPKPKSHDDD